MMQHHQTGKIRKAFTLIEILVVLLIIGILAAILFPVLTSAREKGYQAACATNLHQIYLAVQLYKNDEGRYPASLAPLLPDTQTLGNGDLNVGGKGYFKGGKDALVCPDDDTESTGLRSSYGDVGSVNAADFGNYVWNYLGYRAQADAPAAACTDSDVSQCLGTAYTPAHYGDTSACTTVFSNNCVPVKYAAVFQDVTTPSGQHPYLVNPNDSWDKDNNPVDITKFPRLINRFAPPSTIITQCVFHRLPTSNTAGNYDIYNEADSGKGARDIILRLDGTTKVIDVTTAAFNTVPALPDGTGNAWAIQNF